MKIQAPNFIANILTWTISGMLNVHKKGQSIKLCDIENAALRSVRLFVAKNVKKLLFMQFKINIYLCKCLFLLLNINKQWRKLLTVLTIASFVLNMFV